MKLLIRATDQNAVRDQIVRYLHLRSRTIIAQKITTSSARQREIYDARAEELKNVANDLSAVEVILVDRGAAS